MKTVRTVIALAVALILTLSIIAFASADTVYRTLDEIKSIAVPIAKRYQIAGLYLFGSYARGEATAQSDLDFREDRGQMTDLLELGGLYSDLETGFAQKKLDVLTTQMLSSDFLRHIQPEEITIYAG